ncbi:MAG: DEAD/DEAH box helicase [Saprospiraceae bacterium]|nr:DEAD/DEAH box helicase [Saprospiraceae bacterium]
MTPYHAQYYAFELTKQSSGRTPEKLTSALLDAQVELNPHQVEAALFAFQSPLSQGVILADEVGLGKTIEAGLVIAQKWAEKKRKILIIVPANLRKQWSQELSDKFFLPSVILEKKQFEQELGPSNPNPFERTSQVVICSYQFARTKDRWVAAVEWDLVVLDEAHKLRNVYRKDSKIANAIKEALQGKPKILLTATPLQNSLLELYGLTSIIDDYIFGDLKSFKMQFARISSEEQFNDLRQRIEHVCKRTLRSDVQQYVKFTQRKPFVQRYTPTDKEHELYELVTGYLQKKQLYALPASQRQLVMLIMRRLLASSTFAISGTFKALSDKLQKILDIWELQQKSSDDFDQPIEAELTGNYDGYENARDEFAESEEQEEDQDASFNRTTYSDDEIQAIRAEKAELDHFHQLAASIDENAKGTHLLTALRLGFDELKKMEAPEKALIFTESTRTQIYIKEELEKIPEFKGRIVLFNGTNSDPLSKKIYQDWKREFEGSSRISESESANKRAALVDYFKRPETKIMIATEAGAEGINLQFCSFILNYDLPWNPQRIEQRIGRCHRYNQKHDVVVVNFLNDKNAADQKVYEILDSKFKLFSGVFGASDEVLGNIESGVDFERRVFEIFRTCRDAAEIDEAFETLSNELSGSIQAEMARTRQEILHHFDQEVVEKLKLTGDETGQILDKYHDWLWKLTRFALADYAEFPPGETLKFQLRRNPYPTVQGIPTGPYQLLPKPESNAPEKPAGSYFDRLAAFLIQPVPNKYRAGHPLALAIFDDWKDRPLPLAHLHFAYSGNRAVLQPLIGQSGWLRVAQLALNYDDEQEQMLLMAGCTDDGQTLETEQCRRLFDLDAITEYLNTTDLPDLELNRLLDTEEAACMLQNRNWLNELFERENTKIERWADDRRRAMKTEIENINSEIKLIRAEARRMFQLEAKIEAQRRIKDLEKKRGDLVLRQHDIEAEIEEEKASFLDKMEQRIQQAPHRNVLFSVRWTLSNL